MYLCKQLVFIQRFIWLIVSLIVPQRATIVNMVVFLHNFSVFRIDCTSHWAKIRAERSKSLFSVLFQNIPFGTIWGTIHPKYVRTLICPLKTLGSVQKWCQPGNHENYFFLALCDLFSQVIVPAPCMYIGDILKVGPPQKKIILL